ncbi:hypothetical protein PR048_004964, partial [Dryococelus australis]
MEDTVLSTVSATENYRNEERFNELCQFSLGSNIDIKITIINAKNVQTCLPDLNPESYYMIELYYLKASYQHSQRDLAMKKFGKLRNFMLQTWPEVLQSLRRNNEHKPQSAIGTIMGPATNLYPDGKTLIITCYNMCRGTFIIDPEKNKITSSLHYGTRETQMAWLHFISIETFLWIPFKLWISSREKFKKNENDFSIDS